MKIWKGFGKPKVKIQNIKNIAIFGHADCSEDTPLYKEVTDVAKRLAEAGYTVVDGGGPGVMRAATEGAKLGGGRVIGVTFYPKDVMNFEGRDPKNLIDLEVKTKNYIERTLTLLKEGQVYVIFKGGTGTISEFGMAWGVARLYFGHHKPLILYGDFWHNIIQAFKDNMLLRSEELKVFKIVSTPDEVLRAISEFEREINEGKHEHLKITKGDFSI